MTTRGSLGWVLLLAALTVPGFMFYKWWSRVNKEKQQALTQKVVNRNPDAAMFSAESRPTSPLTNPIAGSSAPGTQSPASAPAAPAAPPVEAASALHSVEPMAPPTAEPIVASASLPVEPAPGAQSNPDGAGDKAAAAAMPPESTALASHAPPRDPTLSPYDAYLLEQIEFNKKFRQSEVQEAVDMAAEDQSAKRSKMEPPIENSIKLQGIISNPEGNRAIVDGEMVSEGDVIGKVKVLRITAQGVTFLHKKRKFMKSVSK